MIFLEIEYSEFFVPAILSTILGMVILGITISAAIKVNKRDRNMTAVIKLLSELCKKSGVDENTIKEIVDKTIQ